MRATSPTHLIVPSAQAGRKLLTAWARSRRPTLGTRAFTPSGLADAVLAEAFPDRAPSVFPELNQVMAVDELLLGMDFRKVEALGWSGDRLARSIREMRVAGVAPEEYRKAIPRRLAREVAGVLEAYEKWLHELGVSDETDRFVRAEFALRKTRAPGRVAVLADTPLSEAARSFLEAFAARAEERLIIGPVDLAPASAAGRVLQEEWSVREEEVHRPDTELVRLKHLEDEVRWVLSDILEKGRSLDEVEVAYPRHTPYLPLLLGETARAGLSVTSAAGVPLSDLPAGQALRLYLRWLGGGRDSRDLVTLFRSGLVRLPDNVWAPRVVEYLLQFHVSGTEKDYSRAFDRLRRVAEQDRARAKGTEREKSASDAVKKLRAAARSVDRLFGYVPPAEESLSGMAGRLRRFVEALVPEDPDAGTDWMEPEPDQALSEAAMGRAELLTRLAQIEAGPDSRHSASHLVRRFLEWIGQVIVLARLDGPGALHVTPLDSAGLAGRRHLYVVGLDSGNFLPSPVEDVFLPDDYCAAFPRLAGPLSSEARVEARSLALKRAIGRTTGSVCVVMAEGSLAADSDSGPASTFLELEAEYGSTDGVVQGGAGLSGLILSCRRDRSARQLIERFFPAVARGFERAEERAGESFSSADGWVGPRRIVDELLDRPLSASRLQQLAACPFQFFQQQVLSIPVIDERRPGQWMTPLENGGLVHDALNRFNREVIDGTTEARDTARALALLEQEFREFARANEPPSEFTWRSKRRELARIAQVVTERDRRVISAELGFGMPAWRTEEEDEAEGEFRLDLGETSLLLRGRIDVVEEDEGRLLITDYKTGRSGAYDREDLLDGGKRLQWVLYAYAYEALSGRPVDRSGYLFVSGEAAGETVYDTPPPIEETGALLGSQFGLARRGGFGASVEPAGQCKWCDFRRVCGDLYGRRSEMQGKALSASEEEVSGWAWGEQQLAKRK